MQGVGAQLEDAAELAGRSRGPEAEFLHEGDLLGGDELSELLVELGEFGVLGDGVEGRVVTIVFLVLPDVDCRC